MKTILVTGAAGFIGYHLTQKLLATGHYRIIGIDNLAEDEAQLKSFRLGALQKKSQFQFLPLDITDATALYDCFAKEKPAIVIHLAARTGVRASTPAQEEYLQTNILGFTNILQACVKNHVQHLIFASSSSVYGDNPHLPFSETAATDTPVSIYAATKKCDEILAAAYAQLYPLHITALRLFTVYGPLGRPDMSYFTFTRKLLNHETITVYNQGNLQRDFTYVADVVEGISRVVAQPPKEKFNLYNLGTGQAIALLTFINLLTDALVQQNLLPSNFDLASHLEYTHMQVGDVYQTQANTGKFSQDFAFKPQTSLETGLANFASWYQEYYHPQKD